MIIKMIIKIMMILCILLSHCFLQQTVMSQMDDEKWAALLENSLTRKEEQKVLTTKHYRDVDQYPLTTFH